MVKINLKIITLLLILIMSGSIWAQVGVESDKQVDLIISDIVLEQEGDKLLGVLTIINSGLNSISTENIKIFISEENNEKIELTNMWLVEELESNFIGNIMFQMSIFEYDRINMNFEILVEEPYIDINKTNNNIKKIITLTNESIGLEVGEQGQEKITSEVELIQVYAKDTSNGFINVNDEISVIVKLSPNSSSINLDDFLIKLDTNDGTQALEYSINNILSNIYYSVNYLSNNGIPISSGYLSSDDLIEIKFKNDYNIFANEDLILTFLSSNSLVKPYNIKIPSYMNVEKTYLYEISSIDNSGTENILIIERFEANKVYLRSFDTKFKIHDIIINNVDKQFTCENKYNYLFEENTVEGITINCNNIIEEENYNVIITTDNGIFSSNIIAKTSSENIKDNLIEVSVLYDPSCINCNEDIYMEQIKYSFPNTDFNFRKIASTSYAINWYLNNFEIKYFPAYIFSGDIEKINDLEDSLNKEIIDGVNYYILEDSFLPNKIIVNNIKLPLNTIEYGTYDAPITIYSFIDYECPFSSMAFGGDLTNEDYFKNYQAPMPKIFENYIEEGKVKLVFLNSPMESLHPTSRIAHNALLCANEQGEWLKFHNRLIDYKYKWIGNSNKNGVFENFAEELNLNKYQFSDCLNTNKYYSQIDKEIKLSKELGITGTPAFIINNEFISGAQDFSEFEKYLEKYKGSTLLDEGIQSDEKYLDVESESISLAEETQFDEKELKVGGQYQYPIDDNEKFFIIENNQVCNGCQDSDICFNFGIRKLDEYGNELFCDTDKTFDFQKTTGMTCQNNFECKSNSCSSGRCTDIVKMLEKQESLLESILNWFNKIFW